MKIIYHCFGGTHSSVTAAAIHLGLLPRDRLPTLRELLAIPFFDRRDGSAQGKLAFMGRDEWDNEIYVVGRQNRPQVLTEVFTGLAAAFDIPRESFSLVNVMDRVNIAMKIGGALSRRLGWVTLGRPLVAWGTRRAYPGLRAVALEVRQQLEERK